MYNRGFACHNDDVFQFEGNRKSWKEKEIREERRGEEGVLSVFRSVE